MTLFAPDKGLVLSSELINDHTDIDGFISLEVWEMRQGWSIGVWVFVKGV